LAKGSDDRLVSGNAGGVRWIRILILIGCVIVLYLVGRWITDMLIAEFSLHLRNRNEPMLHRAIMTATIIYVVLMAIPFMPAVEIGFSMLMIFGPKIALLVYVSTVVALTLAYLIGRYLPSGLAARALRHLGLTRAERYVARLAPLSAQERLEVLLGESPTRLLPLATRHRFLALAVLLNLPGNAVIGGGGGIAVLAGMTRLFPLPAYLLTVAVAAAPVPLIIYFTG
jgi:uncharacterized membrane protein YdjX (TVP38/TMEM64 family)